MLMKEEKFICHEQ